MKKLLLTLTSLLAFQGAWASDYVSIHPSEDIRAIPSNKTMSNGTLNYVSSDSILYFKFTLPQYTGSIERAVVEFHRQGHSQKYEGQADFVLWSADNTLTTSADWNESNTTYETRPPLKDRLGTQPFESLSTPMDPADDNSWKVGGRAFDAYLNKAGPGGTVSIALSIEGAPVYLSSPSMESTETQKRPKLWFRTIEDAGGEDTRTNLGKLSEDNAFYWQVAWPEHKTFNYLTMGGAYPTSPQPNTLWKVQYRIDGAWTDLGSGKGGWINGGTYAWGGPEQAPLTADAIRFKAYSDGTDDVIDIHFRGRGGVSTLNNDRGAAIKGMLVQHFEDDASEPTVIKVNFQPLGATIPTGYFPDYGERYGERENGSTYGWEATMTQHAEGATSDPRLLTTANLTNTWSIEVPNGPYSVLVACGDPSTTDQLNAIAVEGTVANDTDGKDHFDEHIFDNVMVGDGKLTVTATQGSANPKLCFVEITSVDSADLPDLTITDIHATTGKAYALGPIRIGELCYIDRSYTFTELPNILDNATFIKTACDDKRNMAPDLLTFTTNGDATVYVLHDDRFTTKPAWMDGFVDTDADVRNTDNDSVHSVWQKAFPAGTITLGNNADQADGNSMYMVAVKAW